MLNQIGLKSALKVVPTYFFRHHFYFKIPCKTNRVTFESIITLFANSIFIYKPIDSYVLIQNVAPSHNKFIILKYVVTLRSTTDW
jgi:hypothetical protein